MRPGPRGGALGKRAALTRRSRGASSSQASSTDAQCSSPCAEEPRQARLRAASRPWPTPGPPPQARPPLRKRYRCSRACQWAPATGRQGAAAGPGGSLSTSSRKGPRPFLACPRQHPHRKHQPPPTYPSHPPHADRGRRPARQRGRRRAASRGRRGRPAARAGARGLGAAAGEAERLGGGRSIGQPRHAAGAAGRPGRLGGQPVDRRNRTRRSKGRSARLSLGASPSCRSRAARRPVPARASKRLGGLLPDDLDRHPFATESRPHRPRRRQRRRHG